MKDIAKNVVYQILHPEYVYFVLKNHVTNDELTEIFRIMKLIREYSDFYDTHDSIVYENYGLFSRLCSIKNRKYLKYVTKDMMDYSLIHMYKVYDINQMLRIIEPYIDYYEYGDLIYYNMSRALWYNYFCDNDKIENKDMAPYGNIFRIIVEDIKLRKKALDDDYEGFLDFMKLYFTYLCMNPDLYNEDLLLDGYKLILRNHYIDHMALNGAFNSNLKNILQIRMFYINEIINSLSDKKIK